MRVTAFVIPLLLLVPSRSAAQTAASPFEPSLRASAALELAGRGVLASRTAPRVADDVLAPRSGKHGDGVTLMIVGGAAVVVGLIAGGGGGGVLIIAGIACAGYGLYLYNQ